MLPISSIAFPKPDTNFVMPTVIAPKEIPLNKSIIPLKLASPKLEAIAPTILPSVFTIPLAMVCTAFQMV